MYDPGGGKLFEQQHMSLGANGNSMNVVRRSRYESV